MTVRGVVLAVCAACSIGASAWWAWLPLDGVTIETGSRPGVQGTVARDEAPPLEISAFRAPLWVAPPAPPAPPIESAVAASLPPRTPLKWQLLAIVRSDDGERALLYDPDGDQILSVRPGDSIGDRAIERVTSDRVDIRDGSVLRSLALKADKPGAS